MSSPAQRLRVRVPHIAQEAVDRARLRVVPRVRRAKAPKVPFIALVSLVLVVGVVGLLMFNTSLAQATFTSSALEDQADALAAREETLQRELEGLRNSQRVAEQAQAMGMVIPAAPTFLHLADGSVVGPATPAVRDQALALDPAPAIKPAELEPERSVVTVEAPPADPAAAADTSGRKNKKNKPRG